MLPQLFDRKTIQSRLLAGAREIVRTFASQCNQPSIDLDFAVESENRSLAYGNGMRHRHPQAAAMIVAED